MMHTILLSILFLSTILTAPTPPVISETFSATVQIYITDQSGNHSIGSGVWTADQPAGKSVERHIFSDHTEEHLDRFDLHHSYDVFNTKCDPHEIEGNMPALWNWVTNATYAQKVINGETFDAWVLSVGYATVTVAVDSKMNPAWLIREAPQRTVSINFIDWMPSVKNPEIFDVPNFCPPPNGSYIEPRVGCVARADMIDRAEVWVKNKVPYNQGADYDGYREDCSGYVSMAWESAKPGHTTETLSEISKEITKADLQNGDVLLCASEHVVLFGGWADASHTQYIAYEETRPGEGTVKRTTPYPYWYNTGCFIPHRYNEVC